MKTKNFFSYLLIALIFAGIFTACNRDDDTPRVKTPEEIAAENLKEFKDLVGDGIGADVYKAHFMYEEINDLPSETELDKLEFYDFDTGPDGLIFDESGYQIFLGAIHVVIKGTSYSLEKRDDGVFVLSVGFEDNPKFYDRGRLQQNTTCKVKVYYDTNTGKVTNFMNGYIDGVYMAGVLSIYTAQPYDFSKIKMQSQSITQLAERQRAQNYRASGGTFSGVQQVNVALRTDSWIADGIVRLLKPEGEHYVKFTPTNDGFVRAQFCNAQGKVSGNDEKSYFYHETTNHFWANKMPMALNLKQVDFSYNAHDGSIGQGTGVVAQARENNNPEGRFPAFLLGKKKNQDSGANAAIIKTHGNTPDSFILRINLDFELPFYCEITK